MELITVDVSQLIPYEDNPRKNDGAVDAVAESIKQCGYIAPIIVDEDMVVLAGHTRLRALKKLGITTAQIGIVDGLSEEQKRKYRLLDNKTNEFADWDFELLEKELEGLDFDGFDFGFDVDGEEEQDEQDEVEEDDYEVEMPAEPKAKRGQIYQLGRHRLMCGDSTSENDVNRLVDGNVIDLLMTDPPYGIDANKMTMGSGSKEFHRGTENWDSFRPNLRLALSIADRICIWGGNYFTDVLEPTNDWLCWHKKNDGLSFSEFELAWTNFGRNCRHISHHWGDEKKLHVTMKPLDVIVWAMEQTKEKANTVADLFGGSGTTLIACEKTGRSCFMMEYDPRYVDVIIDRWETFTGEKAILLEG